MPFIQRISDQIRRRSVMPNPERDKDVNVNPSAYIFECALCGESVRTKNKDRPDGWYSVKTTFDSSTIIRDFEGLVCGQCFKPTARSLTASERQGFWQRILATLGAVKP